MTTNENGNKIHYIYGILFTIVIGLAGWNLKETHTIAVEMAALKQQVQDHNAWGTGEQAKNLEELKDVHKDVENLRDWVDANFARK